MKKSLIIIGSLIGISFGGIKIGDEVITQRCYIKESHAHLYINENNIRKYFSSESELINGFKKSGMVVYYREDNSDLAKLIEKNEVIDISINIDQLLSLSVKNKPFIEYEIIGSDGESTWTLSNFGENKRLGVYYYQGYIYDQETNSFIETVYSDNLDEVITNSEYISSNLNDIHYFYGENILSNYNKRLKKVNLN